MRDPDDAFTGTLPCVLDDQVGYLRMLCQRHAAIFQTRIQPDLTPMQFSALIRLGESPGCSQNRQRRVMGMDAATIKGVVDRLAAKALMALTPDPADRRRTLIALTPEGGGADRSAAGPGPPVHHRDVGPLDARRAGAVAAPVAQDDLSAA